MAKISSTYRGVSVSGCSPRLAVNSSQDDPFEDLQVMLEEGNVWNLDLVDSQENLPVDPKPLFKLQPPPMCHVCLVKPAIGLRRHTYYSHLP